jgi:hypothetical protein
MMRLGRRATLLVTLSLLTSAATAHAECAWVLWGEHVTWGEASPGGQERRQWEISEVYDTRHACTVELKDEVAKLAAHARTRAEARKERIKAKANVSETGVSTTFLDKDLVPVGGVSSRYRCLPDTVDPRGPKGK